MPNTITSSIYPRLCLLFLLPLLLSLSVQVVSAQQLTSYETVTCPVTTDCSCYQTKNYTCPAGYYCPYTPGQTVSDAEKTQYNCTLNAATNTLQCYCTPGFYCPENTAQPDYCCKGFYCPTPDTAYVCPKGSYCLTGFVEHKSCNVLNRCDEGSDSAGKLSSFVLFVFVIAVTIIFFQVKKVLHRNRINVYAEKLANYQERMSVTGAKGAEDADNGEGKHKETSVEVTPGLGNLECEHVFDIEFDGIGLKLKNGKTIMQGVSGGFKNGRSCAIMGPSGAGKTTIMSLVTGKAKKTHGTIKVNGVEEDLSKYKKLVGYVPQEDVMHRRLSVKDNLTFSANMRLPTSYSRDRREGTVFWAMDTLGLVPIQDSIVGDEEQRGISGGQRKRVNVGLELVAEPSILFLDEPTSGLDSATALELCSTLRDIARNRKMVVAAVIHQPSPSAFAQFDDLLLLGKGGRTVYAGPVDEATAYFASIGFDCPMGENPADYYLDVVSGRIPRNGQKFNPMDLFTMWEEHSKGKKEVTMDEMKKVDKENENAEEHWSDHSKLSRTTRAWRKTKDILYSCVEWLVLLSQDFIEFIRNAFGKDEVRETPGYFLQFWYCFKRAMFQIFRQPGNFIGNQLIHLAVGLFISVAANNAMFVGPVPFFFCATGAQPLLDTCKLPISDQLQQIAVFLAWGISFAGIASGIQTFGNERIIFWRECSFGMSSLSYYFGKVVADFVRVVFAATFFFAFFLLGFTNVGSLGDLYLMILLLYWFGFSMGYFISQICRPANAALVGVALSLVFCVVYGGSKPSVHDVDTESQYDGIRWMWDISAPRWAIEGVYVNQVQYYNTVPSGPLEGQKYMNLTAGLNNMGYDINNYDTDARNVVIITIAWIIFGFIMTKLTHRSKKI
eukprot:Nk52_evm13s2568 gene=Nk52_evmTU13s2568